MSDGEALTLEKLHVEGSDPPTYCCIRCGVPKTREKFHGESLACMKCAENYNLSRQVTDDDLRKTKFELSLDELRDSQTPAIPGGVQRAHKILGGKTASEIAAEMIAEIRTGKSVDDPEQPSFIPRDAKLMVRAVQILQRSEIKHDEFLRSQPPADGVTFEEARSLSIDTFITELQKDKELRIKVLGILYERVPDLISELMQIANVTVVTPESPEVVTVPKKRTDSRTDDLESGGVI